MIGENFNNIFFKIIFRTFGGMGDWVMGGELVSFSFWAGKVVLLIYDPSRQETAGRQS